MSRKYYLIIGITALLAAGCEEGDGSAGGGSNQPPKAAKTKMIVPDPDKFLGTPLATPPIRAEGLSSAPGIDLNPVAGDPIEIFAMNDTPETASANAVASPEPLTAILALTGLGVLGMTSRRRLAA